MATDSRTPSRSITSTRRPSAPPDRATTIAFYVLMGTLAFGVVYLIAMLFVL